MSLSFSLAVRGQLREFRDIEVKSLGQARTSVVRRRTNALKKRLRDQMKRAGLGNRLPNAIRSELIPDRVSFDPTGRVFSKALLKTPGGTVDLVTVFDEGAIITANGHPFLAIPLPAAGKGRRGRSASPADFPPGTFSIRKTPKGWLYVRKSDGVPLFVLVKTVRLKKRLDVAGAYAKALEGIDELTAKTWERFATRGLA